MQTIRYELIPAQGTEGQVAVITFDETNSPVNTMCRQWQQELGEVTAQVLGDRERLGTALKGIVWKGCQIRCQRRASGCELLETNLHRGGCIAVELCHFTFIDVWKHGHVFLHDALNTLKPDWLPVGEVRKDLT